MSEKMGKHVDEDVHLELNVIQSHDDDPRKLSLLKIKPSSPEMKICLVLELKRLVNQ